MIISTSESPGKISAWITTRHGRLAAALLVVELIAGMQSFMHATIGPEIASELNAEKYFGLIYSAVLASSFLTLPWGPKLIEIFGIAKLMLVLTGINALGAVISACAPSIEIFIFGRVIVGASAGVMATASMSAVVQHLPANWRQIVLATFSATYIISSTIGPAYSATVTHLFNWRLSMVLYIPFLILARWIIAKNIDNSVAQSKTANTPPVIVAILMPIGALGISIAGALDSILGLIVALLSITAVSYGAYSLLPKGAFQGVTGRPRAVLVFFLITGLYFAADSILPLLVRNLADATVGQVGVMLTAGGLAWALVGFYCGRKPALTFSSFNKRVITGITLMSLGLMVIPIVFIFAPKYSVIAFIMGWSIASVGMGLSYLDTMNAIFTPPKNGDSMTELDAITSVAFSEQIAAILIATPVAALAGYYISTSYPTNGIYILLFIAFALLCVDVLARKAGVSLPKNI